MLSNGSSGFAPAERRLLLSLPHIGEGVVQRLEAHGIASIQDLRQRGIDRIVAEICREMGTPAWRNRRRPLVEALRALTPPRAE